MMNEALRKTLDALDGVRESGTGWEALCPAHDDTNASLTVAAGDRVPVVVRCQKDCTQEDVLHALRQRMNGHTPAATSFASPGKSAPPKPKKKGPEKEIPEWDLWKDGEQVTAYTYTDAEGDELFQVVRFEPKPTHPAHGLDKEFLQRRRAPEDSKAGRDGYAWGRGGTEPPLYRLPAVLRAAAEGRVVFVVEGEKDADNIEAAGLRATCNLQGAGEWKARHAEDLAGAHVVVLPDNDDAGEKHAQAVASSCHGVAASVRVLRLPGLPKKGDVTDWFEAGHDAEELRELAKKAAEYEAERQSHGQAAPGKTLTQEIAEASQNGEARQKAAEKDDRTQAEVLLGVAAGVELFHTPKQKAYATFDAGGAHQTAPVGSSAFADFLRHGFYAERGKAPSAQALADAKDTLRAKARFDGDKKAVHLRVASHDGGIYIDLCNDAWEAVKITADGWQVVTDPPVKFRRVQGMKALPRPEEGNSLDLLRRHVRLSGDGFLLLLGYLVQSVRPTGPYPILELTGEQGSGKSTAAKMIRALVDPSHLPIRTRPRKERDLVIAAENAWALAFDNMSDVQPWLSDALCRLSTGGGFGTRKLYADREEEIFYARRPMILNGINKLAGRSDLADRAVRLELEAIPEGERRTEADVWQRFEEDRPRIIGALFDAVATALRREPNVELDRLPRMADFARWAVAAEPAFPSALNTNHHGGSAFLAAYTSNRAEANESAVEADTVASAIRAMLQDKDTWEGKTTELMEDLTAYLPDPDDRPKGYPATHQAMSAHLKRIMPDLRAVGIEREDHRRSSGARTFTLRASRQIDSRGATASPASPRHEKASAAHNGRSAMTRRDAHDAVHDAPPATASPKKRPVQPSNGDHDAGDAHDAVDGHQSKDGADVRRATHDGQPVTLIRERGNVCIVEDAEGERFSVQNDALDFSQPAPF